jgi:hypothetical protein
MTVTVPDQELRSIPESAPDAFVIIDSEGRIALTNARQSI